MTTSCCVFDPKNGMFWVPVDVSASETDKKNWFSLRFRFKAKLSEWFPGGDYRRNLG